MSVNLRSMHKVSHAVLNLDLEEEEFAASLNKKTTTTVIIKLFKESDLSITALANWGEKKEAGRSSISKKQEAERSEDLSVVSRPTAADAKCQVSPLHVCSLFPSLTFVQCDPLGARRAFVNFGVPPEDNGRSRAPLELHSSHRYLPPAHHSNQSGCRLETLIDWGFLTLLNKKN
ncbi:hypothetical protein F2P81_026136 [Scophthalmus maximus]|uniref:Uncharacterized protein n=1 Tax=Scophthalmus maximus TaxID=52904 RepID=A0A6A4RQS5_SCOMX|nr:hypothetical protein F2P81_026136 [Scophthalmus maximus]